MHVSVYGVTQAFSRALTERLGTQQRPSSGQDAQKKEQNETHLKLWLLACSLIKIVTETPGCPYSLDWSTGLDIDTRPYI